jgi:lipopolysaccharide export system permease protein
MAFCTVAIIVIYIVIDYVGKIKKFSDVPLRTMAFYYIFVVPYIINLVFSMIMLLTAMFTMGTLAKNSEITAMRSAGFSIFSITRPVIFFSLFLVMLNIVFNETLMPRINKKREKMYKTLIRKRPHQSTISRNNFFYVGKNNIIFHFKGKYDAVMKKGGDVDIEFYQGPQLYKKVSAKALEWKNGAWLAKEVIEYTFLKDSIVAAQVKNMTDFPKPIEEKPEDILKERLLPDEMNFMELREYIENMKRTGQDPPKINALRADLQFKISLPFISFIAVMFSVALTVRVGRSGIAKVFGIGLLFVFLYYFLVHLGLGLGRSGNLHPVLGAWIGNAVFFPLSSGYFYKVSKLE